MISLLQPLNITSVMSTKGKCFSSLLLRLVLHRITIKLAHFFSIEIHFKTSYAPQVDCVITLHFINPLKNKSVAKSNWQVPWPVLILIVVQPQSLNPKKHKFSFHNLTTLYNHIIVNSPNHLGH